MEVTKLGCISTDKPASLDSRILANQNLGLVDLPKQSCKKFPNKEDYLK